MCPLLDPPLSFPGVFGARVITYVLILGFRLCIWATAPTCRCCLCALFCTYVNYFCFLGLQSHILEQRAFQWCSSGSTSSIALLCTETGKPVVHRTRCVHCSCQFEEGFPKKPLCHTSTCYKNCDFLKKTTPYYRSHLVKGQSWRSSPWLSDGARFLVNYSVQASDPLTNAHLHQNPFQLRVLRVRCGVD